MRVMQMLPGIRYGDGVSNDALQIQRLLEEHGIASKIYAEHIGARLPEDIVRPLTELPELNGEDLILYHGSTGSPLNYRLASFPAGRKVMIYHNITPPDFFHGYSDVNEENMREGYRGMRFLADRVDMCIADSAYNRDQLREMGYACPMEVCPILIPFSDYDAEPDRAVVEKYAGKDYVNFLFVGRIAPNKKQEDVIRAFYYYHKYYNPMSRLFLVGNYGGFESYYMRLLRYVGRLQLQDSVIFTGHISFREILGYYHIASVFVCMSEHEGFCIPVVEAMHFSLPVIAYQSSAVPETLGRGGICTPDKDGPVVAAIMDRVVRDARLREAMRQEQRKILDQLRHAPERMWDILEKNITKK